MIMCDTVIFLLLDLGGFKLLNVSSCLLISELINKDDISSGPLQQITRKRTFTYLKFKVLCFVWPPSTLTPQTCPQPLKITSEYEWMNESILSILSIFNSVISKRVKWRKHSSKINKNKAMKMKPYTGSDLICICTIHRSKAKYLRLLWSLTFCLMLMSVYTVTLTNTFHHEVYHEFISYSYSILIFILLYILISLVTSSTFLLLISWGRNFHFWISKCKLLNFFFNFQIKVQTCFLQHRS